MNIKTVHADRRRARTSVGMIAAAHPRAGRRGPAEGGDGKVTVGFRPEDTELVGPSEGGMPIVVDLVEELGSDANVYGHAALNGGDGALRGPHRRRIMPRTWARPSSCKPRTGLAPRVPRRHRRCASSTR